MIFGVPMWDWDAWFVCVYVCVEVRFFSVVFCALLRCLRAWTCVCAQSNYFSSCCASSDFHTQHKLSRSYCFACSPRPQPGSRDTLLHPCLNGLATDGIPIVGRHTQAQHKRASGCKRAGAKISHLSSIGELAAMHALCTCHGRFPSTCDAHSGPSDPANI